MTRSKRSVWVGRDGKVLSEARWEAAYQSFRPSPDGKRLALGMWDDRGNGDLWILELGREVFPRVTFDPARESIPVWSPDGAQIAYFSERTRKPIPVVQTPFADEAP